MKRLLAALLLVGAVALGAAAPLVFVAPRTGLRVPAALVTGEGLEKLRPARGPSRDRSLPGKARRRARQAQAR